MNKTGEIKNIELLAPARNFEAGRMAVLAGADAVYIGGPQFGARAEAGNSWKEIEELVRFAHQYYVKIYLALNTIFFDQESSAFQEAANKAYSIGVDALIIQDMGIMEMDLPPIPIIASTQCHNYESEHIKFLEEAGFSRVILARELSLEQIKKIRRETKIDLEVFVHGALCVSFSGRCYFSQALAGRSANRGQCVQACRLPFSLVDDAGKELARDKFLLSLKDLNLFSHLRELIEAGVTSFKIEGRLKNEIYVGNVVAEYRRELDKIIAESQGKYKRASSGAIELGFEPDLEKTFNRGYTDYFFKGSPFFNKDSKNNVLISLDSQKSLGKFMGKVKEVKSDYFTLDRAHDLKNADGLCWFDAKKELTGVNINVVDKDRIYPAREVSLKPGNDVYRNSDMAFERLVQNGVKRRVAVSFSVKETEKGFKVTAKDEDGNEAEGEYAFVKTLARNSEAEKSWIQQFSKLGETVFFAKDFSFKFEKPYFFPLSILNQWRRSLVPELSRIRSENYPKVSAVHSKTQNPYPAKELDYTFNVSNSLAREFYQRHGARVLEDSFEQQKEVGGKKLMTTKHCLKYFLGACLRKVKPPEFKEPLSLVYGGKAYRLSFDCAKCQMEIWN
ncbi:MAG: U32 family peptidase [Candidatus Nealsonbacteria bacterium]|nr:U32 family peptidase [Candidatus Nealsonbacteria bacterium]